MKRSGARKVAVRKEELQNNMLETGPGGLQEQVLGLAKVINTVDMKRQGGMLYYHTHDSRRSQPGFPDMVFTYPCSGRVIFAELKRQSGSATIDQLGWLLSLVMNNGIEVYLWRPSHFYDGKIYEVLSGTVGGVDHGRLGDGFEGVE